VTPHRVRRPTSPHGRRASGAARASFVRPIVTGLALLALAGAVVAGAAACGGSSGSSPAASPSPTAVPAPGTAPLAGSVREAATQYWRIVDAGDYAAVAAAGVPGQPPSATAATSGIAHVRLTGVDQVIRQKNAPAGERLAQVRVHIEPTSVSGQPSPWGSPGEHTLFMYMERAPQGGWLVKSWGTGP